MKLAVFGATGPSGRLLVEQALAEGHEVVAFARNPGKLELEHERLTIVAGELTDEGAIDRQRACAIRRTGRICFTVFSSP